MSLSLSTKTYLPLILFLNICWPQASFADVVKPALVEITVNTSGNVEIEIRASIEALLTGINAQYKNTTEAPNAEAYDALRVLGSDELEQKFQPFKQLFLSQIRLEADQQPVPLEVKYLKIPEPGYTKVPRISIINLTSKLDFTTESLIWYYPARFGDNAVRVRQVDNEKEKWHWSQWQWLRKDQTSQAFSLAELFTRQPVYKVVLSYISIGFDHIIPKGLDHILFIFGIFLLSTKMRPLLWQVTMFTIAHTITLGLAMNGIITLPARIVEPMIALSIAYIGIENIFSNKADNTSLHKSRLMLVFVFGLLHGLGFAGVLGDFGMPDNAFATALISFNIGVELGQIAVIGIAFFSIALWFKKAPEAYRKFIIIPGSLMISVIGLYWTLERLELF